MKIIRYQLQKGKIFRLIIYLFDDTESCYVPEYVICLQRKDKNRQKQKYKLFFCEKLVVEAHKTLMKTSKHTRYVQVFAQRQKTIGDLLLMRVGSSRQKEQKFIFKVMKRISSLL